LNSAENHTVVSSLANIDIRDAFFDSLYDIAKEDRNVVFLTADMGARSLDKFKADLPGQYSNVGIAEQNMVSVAAGLSLSGKRVFIYAIAPFVTQRCYEQVKVDISGMNLPVTIVGIGAGISYTSDGLSHHATQDVAVMRALPNIAIYTPADCQSASMTAFLSYKSDGPTYVRLDKGAYPVLYGKQERFTLGIAELKKGKDVLIISTGIMTHQALTICDELTKRGMSPGVADLYRIKPLNCQAVLDLLGSYSRIVTMEEHSIVGGIGSAISELLTDHGICDKPLKRVALDDANCKGYGDRAWVHLQHGMDVNTVTQMILQWSATKGN